jgi:hypothetical protein
VGILELFIVCLLLGRLFIPDSSNRRLHQQFKIVIPLQSGSKG